MKKGIRIFLMIVVVVLVFAGVQWVPNIVNQMQEKKDLGQAVITKDSTSKKNIGMQLSYAEKMDILSASPNQLYLFKTKNKNQLLEYDGKFFEKLNTQLKKFTELKIMDFSRLSKNLEKSFKQASYYYGITRKPSNTASMPLIGSISVTITFAPKPLARMATPLPHQP